MNFELEKDKCQPQNRSASPESVSRFYGWTREEYQRHERSNHPKQHFYPLIQTRKEHKENTENISYVYYLCIYLIIYF